MAATARWIRCGLTGPRDLHARCAGLALAQGPGAAPVVLWAQANAPMSGNLLRAEALHFVFALIVPLRLAPGRRSRWCAWGLAPALATYRKFGIGAYFDDQAMCLNGRRLGDASARHVGDCMVVASSFLPRPPGAAGEWPERALEAAFRDRIEAQHGWQFETCWPSAEERAEIADVLALEAAGAA